MFLKNAMSLLKIDGMRNEFRGVLPISPSRVGLAKQLTFTTYGVPVGSEPLMFRIGSQIVFGRALSCPPVISVTPPLYVTAMFFGLPLAYDVVPVICQLSNIAFTNPLLTFRLKLGTSQM